MRIRTLAIALRAWGLAAILSLLPGLALGCPVCIDLPERTVADHVLEDWIVVLARPDPDDPFRFAPVELVRGDPEDLADAPEIPFLVDGTARRALARDPERSVLLSYGPPGDYAGLAPGSGRWYRHFAMTPHRRDMLDGILARGALWDWGMTTDPDRFDFFAARHGDHDPTIQRLALTEISRAPYSMIRQIDVALPPQILRERLTRVTQLPLAPVTILLLGISDTPEAEAAVRRGFANALARGGSSAAAWVVAGLERDGAAALDRVAARLNGTPAPPPEDRLDILTALAVTGSARPDLRAAIAPVLVDAAERWPDHAGALAYSFYAWRDWSIVPLYAEMLDGTLDHDTRYILEIVVATAQADQADATELR